MGAGVASAAAAGKSRRANTRNFLRRTGFADA